MGGGFVTLGGLPLTKVTVPPIHMKLNPPLPPLSLATLHLLPLFIWNTEAATRGLARSVHSGVALCDALACRSLCGRDISCT